MTFQDLHLFKSVSPWDYVSAGLCYKGRQSRDNWRSRAGRKNSTGRKSCLQSVTVTGTSSTSTHPCRWCCVGLPVSVSLRECPWTNTAAQASQCHDLTKAQTFTQPPHRSLQCWKHLLSCCRLTDSLWGFNHSSKVGKHQSMHKNTKKATLHTYAWVLFTYTP